MHILLYFLFAFNFVFFSDKRGIAASLRVVRELALGLISYLRANYALKNIEAARLFCIDNCNICAIIRVGKKDKYSGNKLIWQQCVYTCRFLCKGG